MYGAQCGMTHPNIFVLGEIITPTEGGITQFVHRARDIDKEVRAAFMTFTRGVMIWSRYFSTEADFDSLQSQVGDIAVPGLRVPQSCWNRKPTSRTT